MKTNSKRPRVIKLSYFIAAILAILVLVVASFMLSKVKEGGTSSAADGTAAINTIMTRTSVRSYQAVPVEKDKIETMLRAAMASPTGMNCQPWHFTVVTDKKLLRALSVANPNAGFVADAPLAIVVSGDMNLAGPGRDRNLWIQDCSAATENLLLAAHALGLGATWTSTYPAEDRMQAVRQALNLPSNLIPFNTIGIGYPAGDNQPKDKWDPSKVTYVEEGKAPVTAEPVEKTLQAFDVTKDFRANGFTFFAKESPILLAGDKESFNAMTIGWGAIGNLWGQDRATVTVYVAQSRYTHEFMEGKSHFTIMTFKDKNIADYMGHHSGRDTDKVKDLGLTVAYTENGTPYFEEADVVIECETMYGQKMSQSAFRNEVPRQLYSNFPAGIHTFYIGQVVSALKRQ